MALKNIRQYLGWYLGVRRAQGKFERVEQQLRQEDISHWPVELQIARRQQLARLHNYGQRESSKQDK